MYSGKSCEEAIGSLQEVVKGSCEALPVRLLKNYINVNKV